VKEGSIKVLIKSCFFFNSPTLQWLMLSTGIGSIQGGNHDQHCTGPWW